MSTVTALPGRTHVEHVMGTTVSLTLVDEPNPAGLAAALAGLHEADATFSTYLPQSPLSRLARGENTLDECPAEVAEVLLRCAAARAWTRGAFDPWRLGTDDGPGLLDPSGLVKGWAIQRASDTLVAGGAPRHSINGGGDVLLRGVRPGRPWRVGVSDPWRPGRLLGVVVGDPDGRDRAVATSGTAERGLHIADPRTGRAATGIVSATVVGPAIVEADVAATAAVVLGADALDWLAEQPGLEALLLTDRGEVLRTAGWASVAG